MQAFTRDTLVLRIKKYGARFQEIYLATSHVPEEISLAAVSWIRGGTPEAHRGPPRRSCPSSPFIVVHK